MNTKIKNVVVVIPVFNELLKTIENLLDRIKLVQDELLGKDIELSHFFLDDGAKNLPAESSRLIKHETNLGLTKTLLDGYKAVLGLSEVPDVVIRMDCQEHDSSMIPKIIDMFSSPPTQAIFLPICYGVDEKSRPSLESINHDIASFKSAILPINRNEVLKIYNQKFPIGFQALRFLALKKIIQDLEEGYNLFEKHYGKPRWGIDLLTIFLTARQYPKEINFIFGGWMKPWEENRSEDKTEAQRKNTENIIDIATRLGCKTT